MMASQRILCGDCVGAMAGMEPNSFDAICTDPPYGLEFMGNEWDDLGIGASWERGAGFSSPGIGDRPTKWVSHSATSGYAAANPTCGVCGGRLRGAKKCACPEPDWKPIGERRTAHDAPEGMTGSGRQRHLMAMQEWHRLWLVEAFRVLKPGGVLMAFGGTRTWHRLAVAIEDAGFVIFDTLMWLHGQGFPKHKTLLKPAWEPIVLAKKPGPGGLRTEAGRIGTTKDVPASVSRRTPDVCYGRFTEFGETSGVGGHDLNLGRWPANVALSHHPECVETGVRRVKSGNPGNKVLVGDDTTPHVYEGGYSRRSAVGHADPDGHETVASWSCHPDCPVALLDAMSGERQAGARPARRAGIGYMSSAWGTDDGERIEMGGGGTSRFFYCAKADRAERILPDGSRCSHPTQKPINLMVWLVRLACPPGGTLLDPFLGSGTTLIAADRVGVDGVGIEREPSYAREAEARVRGDFPLFVDVVLEEVP